MAKARSNGRYLGRQQISSEYGSVLVFHQGLRADDRVGSRWPVLDEQLAVAETAMKFVPVLVVLKPACVVDLLFEVLQPFLAALVVVERKEFRGLLCAQCERNAQ